jgi:glycosyltransferase involved in cell wall biosynthesis
MKRATIAIFISYSGQGGVERMINNLAQGLMDAGFGVDLVLARTRGKHLEAIPDGVRIIRLGARHTWTALPGLITYLRKENPDRLLAVKDRAIRVSILARWFSGTRVPMAGRLGTTVSAALQNRSRFRRWIWYSGMRFFYRWVDRIVAVSEGVAEDVRKITKLPHDRVTVVRNPVITSDLLSRAAEPVDDPWFRDSSVPVIVGIGRLTEQKDFPTLIRAFTLVRDRKPCRLMILGEGRQRKNLENMVEGSGLGSVVQLPGFFSNPYAFLSKSSLFVLSSRWEGSPNTLTEALALGVPVVSTDCPSGPREILDNGKFGPLIPMGNPGIMADAIVQTLDNPLSPNLLKSAVSEYTDTKSAEGYIKALDLLHC